nr:AMP-binding protein [Clostridia bacterium]
MQYFDGFPIYTTVKELVLEGAARGGDKLEFVFEDDDGTEQRRTFKEVHEDEMRLGAYLAKNGIAPPMKIAILSENSYMWNVVYYAAAAGGFVIVPLDVRLSAAEIAYQMENCACEVLFYSTDNEDKANTASSVRYRFNMDLLGPVLEEGEAARAEFEEKFLSYPVEPEDLLAIVYTSGTTGKTKGVMLSHKGVMTDINASLHANTGGHAIAFLPLNHTYSWVTGLYAGLIMNEWGFICTRITRIYKDIKKYKPRQFAAVPFAVEMIYNKIISNAKLNGKYDLLMKGIETSRNFLLSGFDARRELFADIHEQLGGELEYIMCGGAYLDPKIEQFMYDIGIPVITGYGMTECSPCVTCSRLYD